MSDESQSRSVGLRDSSAEFPRPFCRQQSQQLATRDHLTSSQELNRGAVDSINRAREPDLGHDICSKGELGQRSFLPRPHHTTMAASKDFLDQLPKIVASTLSALKKLTLLETHIQHFIESDQSEDAFNALEHSAKPILLDAGTGKKGTADVLAAWKKVATAPKTNNNDTSSKTESSSGAEPALGGTGNSATKSGKSARGSLPQHHAVF